GAARDSHARPIDLRVHVRRDHLNIRPRRQQLAKLRRRDASTADQHDAAAGERQKQWQQLRHNKASGAFHQPEKGSPPISTPYNLRLRTAPPLLPLRFAGALPPGAYAVRVAAQCLPVGVVPEHYELTFAANPSPASFDGTETIRVRVEQATPRIVLNAVDIQF